MAEDMEQGRRLAGRCLCGAVTFSAVPKAGMHACHCEICRRTSGGVFLSVDCGDSVETEGDLRTYVSSEWGERQFCGVCGSSLFWHARDGSMTIVSVQAFDDPSSFAFETEYCIDRKPSSYAFAGDRPKVTAAELAALFAGEG